MTDQEALIREAIATEADQAVDYRTVLANLHAKRSRRRPIALIAAVTLTVAAAAVAVIVPLSVDRTAAPVDPAAPPATPQTMLLIGLDGEAHTDSVVLARVGSDGAVSAASLPRDSFVDIPGVGRERLNMVYPLAHATARSEGRDGDAAGAQALVQTVEGLTGVAIDHYAAVDMAAFGALADAVGGVEVCLRAAARDDLSGVDLPAGRQSLGGTQSLAFLRQRFGLANGDLDRIVRQQAFLHSLAAKIAGVDDPATLARLVDLARTHIRTDPDWDLPALARHLTPTVRTAIIPVPDPVALDNVHGFPVDPAAVKSFATDFFTDHPAGTPTGTPEQPTNDGCVN
jgi:LCP family protein required for cell wall assembly